MFYSWTSRFYLSPDETVHRDMVYASVLLLSSYRSSTEEPVYAFTPDLRYILSWFKLILVYSTAIFSVYWIHCLLTGLFKTNIYTECTSVEERTDVTCHGSLIVSWSVWKRCLEPRTVKGLMLQTVLNTVLVILFFLLIFLFLGLPGNADSLNIVAVWDDLLSFPIGPHSFGYAYLWNGCLSFHDDIEMSSSCCHGEPRSTWRY